MNELQLLKEKLLALQGGDFDVEAENPRIVRCWERLGCDKKDCPAYGRLRCWSIAGTSCHGKVEGEFAKKLGDCRQCVVYRESCGDETSEFIEIFNQTVKDLKFNLSEQGNNEKARAAEARHAEMGKMVAAVAHESRNPLHSIGLAASYLKKNFQGELVTEFIKIIEAEVGKLNELTSIFLRFATPSPLALGPCELNSVVREAIAGFRRQNPGVDIPIDFEPCPGLIPAICDPERIREAVNNLLDNAVETDPPGDRIIVRTSKDDSRTVIEVEDRGPGIETGREESIFTPFYTTKAHGHGLGLAIVERTAREHRGSVSGKNIPGKGAAFTITLPR